VEKYKKKTIYFGKIPGNFRWNVAFFQWPGCRFIGGGAGFSELTVYLIIGNSASVANQKH